MGKIKVLVSGCNGHMGEIVCQLIEESDDMEVVAGFDTAAREFPTFPVFENINDLQDAYEEDENMRPDVIIDFSSPACTMELLDYARRNHMNMLIYTTGFTDNQMSKIRTYSSYIKVFIDDMSYEVNLLVKSLKEISPKLVEDNDIVFNLSGKSAEGALKAARYLL